MRGDEETTIEAELLALFRRNVKKPLRERVQRSARLQADLQLDSLGVLSTMLAAEEALGVSLFPLPPDVGEIATVGDVIALFEALPRAAARG